MRKKLGVQLAVADLFTAPTIEALATKISVLQTLGSPSGVTASGKPRQGTYGSYGSYGWMLKLFCDLLLGSFFLSFFKFELDFILRFIPYIHIHTHSLIYTHTHTHTLTHTHTASQLTLNYFSLTVCHSQHSL